jgi:hypothetical protein
VVCPCIIIVKYLIICGLFFHFWGDVEFSERTVEWQFKTSSIEIKQPNGFIIKGLFGYRGQSFYKDFTPTELFVSLINSLHPLFIPAEHLNRGEIDCIAYFCA